MNSLDLTNPLPCSPEAEKAVLSIAMQDAPGVFKALPDLTENHFYDPAYAIIWRTLKKMAEDGSGIDLITINDHLLNAGELDAIGGTGALGEISISSGVPSHLSDYADTLRGKLARRKVWQAADQVQRAARDEAVPLNDAIAAPLEKLSKLRDSTPSSNAPRITGKALQGCVLSCSSLETLQIQKRPTLLDDWLCQGDLGYIYAPRGVGKTWLSMSLPMAISSGNGLGLWSAGEHRAKVLYVDGEMPLELTKARNRSLRIGQGAGISYLHHDRIFELLESSLNIALPSHQRAITDLLIEGGFNFLVLDNLSCLASGMDENHSMDHEAVSNWYLELRRRKITVMVDHHAGRNGMMRGTSKREDACSWILHLRDAKQDGDDGAKFITHFSKPSRNTSKANPDLLWHYQTSETGITEITCELAEMNEYEQFIQHVTDGVESQSEIAELMDRPKGTISKWTKKAAGFGRITRKGNILLPAKL